MSAASPLILAWSRVVSLQGIGFLLAMSTVALAAVVVPPEIYGLYGLQLSVVQIAAGIGMSWLNQVAVRFGREEFTRHGRVGATIGSVFVMQAALLVLVTGLYLIVLPRLAPFIGPGFSVTPVVIVILVAVLCAQVAAEGSNYLAQSVGRFTGYGLGQLVSRLGSAAAVVAIALGLPADARCLLLGAGIGWLLAAMLTLGTIPAGIRAGICVDPALMRRMIAYGWRLPAASLAGMAVAWMDVWFIKAYAGIAEAGVYAWAYALFNLAAIALIALSAVLTPQLIDLHLAGRPERIASGLAAISAIFLLLLGLAPLLLALIRLLGGVALPVAYAGALEPLVFLAGAIGFQFLSYAVSPLLMADERQVGAVVAVNLAVAAINAAGDLLLVPRLAGDGAAIAKLVAIAGGALVFYALARRSCREAGAALPGLVGFTATGAVLLAVAMAVAWAPLQYGLPVALLGCLALIAAPRRAGLLQPLATLAPHLAPLPGALRGRLIAVLHWLAGPGRPAQGERR